MTEESNTDQSKPDNLKEPKLKYELGRVSGDEESLKHNWKQWIHFIKQQVANLNKDKKEKI